MTDQIDLQILQCLKENARVNASEISERVNMSVSAVIERIKKLEANGIIEGYTVLLNHKRLGIDVCAYMSVSLDHPKYTDGFIEAIKQNARVAECNYITGDFDFMLKIRACSTDDLTATLNEIKMVPGVSLTRTLLVLSTPKHEAAVLPEMGRI